MEQHLQKTMMSLSKCLQIRRKALENLPIQTRKADSKERSDWADEQIPNYTLKFTVFLLIGYKIMSALVKSKLKFLLIIPILVGVIYFGTSVSDFDILESMDTQKWVLDQFAINYGAMMIACGKDGLDPEELQSCLDAFDEVREFCAVESAEQCGDEAMEQLEQKLSDL